jgi:hypothetical protein
MFVVLGRQNTRDENKEVSVTDVKLKHTKNNKEKINSIERKN